MTIRRSGRWKMKQKQKENNATGGLSRPKRDFVVMKGTTTWDGHKGAFKGKWSYNYSGGPDSTTAEDWASFDHSITAGVEVWHPAAGSFGLVRVASSDNELENTTYDSKMTSPICMGFSRSTSKLLPNTILLQGTFAVVMANGESEDVKERLQVTRPIVTQEEENEMGQVDEQRASTPRSGRNKEAIIPIAWGFGRNKYGRFGMHCCNVSLEELEVVIEKDSMESEDPNEEKKGMRCFKWYPPPPTFTSPKKKVVKAPPIPSIDSSMKSSIASDEKKKRSSFKRSAANTCESSKGETTKKREDI